MANIIKGLKPVFAKKQVIPSPSELRLACRCGGMEFSIMVMPKPPELTMSRVSAIVCKKCKRSVKVLLDGTIDKDGKQDRLSKLHGQLASIGEQLDAELDP